MYSASASVVPGGSAIEALAGRDLISLADLITDEVHAVLDLASAIKAEVASGGTGSGAVGGTMGAARAVAVILQKPSLRTHLSFEVGIHRLGGHPVMMTGENGAFSRGESIADTARVLERFVDAIVLRTFAHETIQDLAAYASVPVVNALTDDEHPCQGLADLLTIREHFGSFEGLTMAYVGDGSNNMAHTYLLAGAHTGMRTVIGTPAAYQPSEVYVTSAREIAAATGGSVEVLEDPRAAVAGADIVITDTWASMGQEGEHDERAGVFEPYQVNDNLMALASERAVFLHCLPAHRGEEATDSVLDGPRSLIFDEAENRVHAQQAVLAAVLGVGRRTE